MFLHPALSTIVAATRDRWWRLPQLVSERRRQRRNAYMRGYMRAYRQAAHRLSLSLSHEEHRRLAWEAEAVGCTPTACFHAAAFAYFDRRTLLPKAYADNIAEAIGEIRRVGNNINQLAYHANARRKTTQRDLQEARRLLTALEAVVARLLTPPPLPDAPPAPPAPAA